MDHIGFAKREHAEEFPTGRWILVFIVGDVAWWTAWLCICSWFESDKLLAAIFFPLPSLSLPHLAGTLIAVAPFALQWFIVRKLQFGERSQLDLPVWIGATCVLNFVTRFLVMFVLLSL